MAELRKGLNICPRCGSNLWEGAKEGQYCSASCKSRARGWRLHYGDRSYDKRLDSYG